MPEQTETAPLDLDPLAERLGSEFAGVHDGATVRRCLGAARQGALEVTGRAAPDLVERIARQHLRVLEMALTERG
ncbi:hypothetical protein [Nocardiopsis composta]|uniref:Uncharacterized protein n=1 Tax=Nocardiopsis composta TaxID=157465 RepID=A0A7W8VEY1_9ACTN|nr:hypothetical protein [Nocardiopsis composta]MBB5433568.1 hypothetical protein [Nocardiopsis composta]